jgi:hypothetical protein
MKMAKCEVCEKDMLKAKGCLHRDYLIDGERIQALEHRDRYVVSDRNHRCGDCNAEEGQPHHLGCDQEECPSCGLQFIGCDCDVSEEMFVFPNGRKVKK